MKKILSSALPVAFRRCLRRHSGVRKKALFVVQLKAVPEIVAADELMKAHLAELGFAVTVADQRDPEPAAVGLSEFLRSRTWA